MISAREVVTGIAGAWWLLHFDRGAVSVFDASIDGFWKSFFAAIIVLPGVIFLQLLSSIGAPETETTAGPARVVIVFAVGYVYQWVTFPFVMLFVADLIGRPEKYLGYIVAHNWSQTIQIGIIIPATLFLAIERIAPTGMGTLIFIACIVFLLIYGWFIAKAALEVSAKTAALVVVIQIAITVGLALVQIGLVSPES